MSLLLSEDCFWLLKCNLKSPSVVLKKTLSGFILVEATHLYKYLCSCIFYSVGHCSCTVLMFSGNSFLLCAVISDFMFPAHFYAVSIKNLVEFIIFLEVLF